MKRRLLPLLASLALPCAAQVPATVAPPPPQIAPGAAPKPQAPAAAADPARATSQPTRAPVAVANAGTSADRANKPREPGEPEVRHTVIEGETTRIDELTVRGVPQRIVVTAKGRGGSYEIITGDGSRDLSDGANTSRGAAGKRVWRVLDF